VTCPCREALRDLYAEVEMAESVGICLPDRVPSLRARDALAKPCRYAEAELLADKLARENTELHRALQAALLRERNAE
jgi:hypothetical protein